MRCDDNGWATYEKKRGGMLLEMLNASEVFGKINVLCPVSQQSPFGRNRFYILTPQIKLQLTWFLYSANTERLNIPGSFIFFFNNLQLLEFSFLPCSKTCPNINHWSLRGCYLFLCKMLGQKYTYYECYFNVNHTPPTLKVN